MSRKNIFKIILDIVMTALFVLMFDKNALGIGFHEIGGLILCGLMILHVAFNWKWIGGVTKGLFGKKISGRARLEYVVDLLLLVAVVFILISGIMISKTILPNVSSHNALFKYGHMGVAAIGLMLLGIHIGFKWNVIMGAFKKMIRLSIPQKAMRTVLVCITAAVVGFGCYSIATTNFVKTVGTTTMMFNGGQDRAVSGQGGEGEHAQGQNAQGNNGQAVSGQRPGRGDGQTPQGNEGQTPRGGNGGAMQGEGTGRPSGDIGGQRGQNSDGGGAFGGRAEQGRSNTGASGILFLLTSYISILGVFVTLGYYTSKLLRRKRVSIG